MIMIIEVKLAQDITHHSRPYRSIQHKPIREKERLKNFVLLKGSVSQAVELNTLSSLGTLLILMKFLKMLP